MNVQTMNASVSSAAARAALLEYKAHRNVYDKRDWEIERIYRQIAKGKTVIAALAAIRAAGLDDNGFPRLAIMRADQTVCQCDRNSTEIILRNDHWSRYFAISWPDRPHVQGGWRNGTALLPRIPPQYRPPHGELHKYHLLWEANWTVDPPRDPYLLKRIGKDAWVVLAAWDLTYVELSVIRAHEVRQ